MSEFKAGGDLCLGFWKEALESAPIVFPPNAKVLEVGCAEADWISPMMEMRPDLEITGIDWRKIERPKAKEVIQDDVLVHGFQGGSFDAIVCVSTVEHIGLGSYNEDPLDDNGDIHAMGRFRDWLKPNGFLYVDVPHRPNGPYHVCGNFRGYDEPNLEKRLNSTPGLELVWRKEMGTPHGDGPYIALLWRKSAAS